VLGYHKRVILSDLDLSITGPGVVGLMGPNGSGKTTVLKAVAGLLAPRSGQLRVNGEDPRRPSQQLRRQLRFLPARPALWGELSVGNTLAYFAELYGTTPESPAPFELDRYSNQMVGQLSMGWQVRLALAGVVCGAPGLILADEPRNGLEPDAVEEMWLRLRDLASTRGSLVLVSSHYLEELAQYCDRVLLVKDAMVTDFGRRQWQDHPDGLLGLYRSGSADRPCSG
jgi:ABC-2 type transport system ATP-binding protein